MNQDFRFGVVVPHLRAWRQSRFLTQAELAERVGVTRDTILAAEHGRPVRISTIAKLAKLFGVDRQVLVHNTPPD
jgi:DNA-binding XRE family transcriptional regulator